MVTNYIYPAIIFDKLFSAAERLKRGLQHARQLVRESQAEAEKLVRSQN